jgi:hypothetical protein
MYNLLLKREVTGLLLKPFSQEFFKKAIDSGYHPARAELAFISIENKLSLWYKIGQWCKEYRLVREGANFGCYHCKGMMAIYKVTKRERLNLTVCDEEVYSLAIESAASGSLFGKMALITIFKNLLEPKDFEEIFPIMWSDQFIKDFFGQIPIPVSNFEEDDSLEDLSFYDRDTNILTVYEMTSIYEYLIDEIKQSQFANYL